MLNTVFVCDICSFDAVVRFLHNLNNIINWVFNLVSIYCCLFHYSSVLSHNLNYSAVLQSRWSQIIVVIFYYYLHYAKWKNSRNTRAYNGSEQALIVDNTDPFCWHHRHLIRGSGVYFVSSWKLEIVFFSTAKDKASQSACKWKYLIYQ
jgi:hypothetical protein